MEPDTEGMPLARRVIIDPARHTPEMWDRCLVGFENRMINSYDGVRKMIGRPLERIGVDTYAQRTFEYGFHFSGMFVGDKYEERLECADYNLRLKAGYNKRSAEKLNHNQSCVVC